MIQMELQLHAMALQTPYMPSLLSSAIKIPSSDWDKGNRYSEWLRFRIELDSIFDTPTYTSLTAKDQIALMLHWMGPEMQKLYYSWPEPEHDAIELNIQHFLTMLLSSGDP